MTSTWRILFLCRFGKVLGRKVDIDNESSKEECQQAPRLARMAIAVMAISQSFELPCEVLCGLKFWPSKGCFGSRQPYCASCPSKLAFKRLDLQLVEVFSVEISRLKFNTQTLSDSCHSRKVTPSGLHPQHLGWDSNPMIVNKKREFLQFSYLFASAFSVCFSFLFVAGQYYPY